MRLLVDHLAQSSLKGLRAGLIAGN